MIRGLIAPILSPFTDDLSFDQITYNKLAKDLSALDAPDSPRLGPPERRYRSV